MGDIRDLYFHSTYPIDKILGTFEGSFTVGGGVPFGEHIEPINTNIPESTFYQGVYSRDGGVSWIDLGSTDSNITDLAVIGRSNQSVFTVNARNFGASPHTVHYKVALIAKGNQGNVSPQPIGEDIIFDSRLNYQKIFRDYSAPVSVSNGAEHTEPVAHNLGYIPKVRGFIELSSDFGSYTLAGLYEFGAFARASLSSGSTPDTGREHTSGIYIDNNNAYAGIFNKGGIGTLNATLYARVYYDG